MVLFLKMRVQLVRLVVLWVTSALEQKFVLSIWRVIFYLSMCRVGQDQGQTETELDETRVSVSKWLRNGAKSLVSVS